MVATSRLAALDPLGLADPNASWRRADHWFWRCSPDRLRIPDHHDSATIGRVALRLDVYLCAAIRGVALSVHSLRPALPLLGWLDSDRDFGHAFRVRPYGVWNRQPGESSCWVFPRVGLLEERIACHSHPLACQRQLLSAARAARGVVSGPFLEHVCGTLMESSEPPRNPEISPVLRRQQDYAAIAEGLAEMEAGGGLPIEEAHREALRRLQSFGQ